MPERLSRIALRTSLLYAFFAALWIVLTDRAVVAIWSDPSTIGTIATYKGWAFVAVTALLLYGTLRGQLQRWTEEIERRQKAEATLRRYELIAIHTRDIVLFMKAENGRLIEANTAAVNAYGYSPEELLALTIHDLRSPDQQTSTAGQMVEAAAQGILFETVHRRKDGSTFPVEVSSRGATIDGTSMLISVIRDISVRRGVEEALQTAHDELEVRVRERTDELQRAYEKLKAEISEREHLQAQLRQAQKMEALGTLAGGLAHDFNNILAAMIGFTELTKDHLPSGSRDERHLQRVLDAGLRGRELVKRMLTFSRRSEQEMKPLVLSSVLEETIRLVRAATPTTVSINVSKRNETSVILGDHVQMQQVIMNLCTNALHAMKEQGGTLDVELSDCDISPSHGELRSIDPGLYVKLAIRDSGVGMSSDVMERAFDPFFTTKGLGEGTGLGLSVVHGIVKHFNGHITVESEPGKGSVFTVYFPKIVGEPAIDKANEGALLTGSERVLLVDDEEALVAMGEDALAELGYEVTSHMSSREALALFRLDPSRFDLVITDQTMPEMTGMELAGEILAIRPDLPIIVCTGFSHVVDVEKAKGAGIAAFVMKPLTKREIARTIRQVLKG